MSRRKKTKPQNRGKSQTRLPLSAAERKLRAIEPVVGNDPARALQLLEDMRDRYRLPSKYYALVAQALKDTGSEPIEILRVLLQAETPDQDLATFIRIRGLLEAASGFPLAAYEDLTQAESIDGNSGIVVVPREDFEAVRDAAQGEIGELGLQWPDDISIAAALDRCDALVCTALYAEALDPLREIVQVSPSSSVAGFYYAATLWALCRFEEAISVVGTAEELDDLALLCSGAKFHALLGNPDAARRYSDRAVTVPITTANHLMWAVQAHAWSDEHSRVATTVEQHQDIVNALPDDVKQGVLHSWAVAGARTGDLAAAKRIWRKLDTDSNDLYRENLQAVEQPDETRSQPWYFEIGDLIPSAVGRMLEERGVPEEEAPALACSAYPGLKRILPQFHRYGGPDSARFADRARGIETNGEDKPIERTTIGSYIVYLEPTESPPENIADLTKEAYELLRAGTPKRAERLLREAISRSTSHPAVYQNLAVALEQQDKEEEALETVREIHRRWPDYSFARCTLAADATSRGSIHEARELIQPVLSQDALHVTEFTALCRAMCAINLQEYQWDELEQWIAYWREADPENSGMDRFEALANAGRSLHKLISEPLPKGTETLPDERFQRDNTSPRKKRPRSKPKRSEEDPRQGKLFP